MKKTQIEQVREYLLNGWVTLYYMAAALGASDSGVSARVRDCRKPEHGGYDVIKRKIPNTRSYQYRIKGVL